VRKKKRKDGNEGFREDTSLCAHRRKNRVSNPLLTGKQVTKRKGKGKRALTLFLLAERGEKKTPKGKGNGEGRKKKRGEIFRWIGRMVGGERRRGCFSLVICGARRKKSEGVKGRERRHQDHFDELLSTEGVGKREYVWKKERRGRPSLRNASSYAPDVEGKWRKKRKKKIMVEEGERWQQSFV